MYVDVVMSVLHGHPVGLSAACSVYNRAGGVKCRQFATGGLSAGLQYSCGASVGKKGRLSLVHVSRVPDKITYHLIHFTLHNISIGLPP